MIFAASALFLAGCTSAIELTLEPDSNEAKRVEYSFTVGADTKAAISDAGAFSWTAGDKVAVWDAQNGTFDEFTVQQSGASSTITGTGLADANYTKAYYPASVATAGEDSIVWPDSYESAAVAAKSFPMMAVNDNGTLTFKHLGALLKVTITDLPSNVSSLVFTATNKGVSGTLAVDATDTEHPFCAVGSSSSSIVIANADAETDEDDTIFYLPLPTGELDGGFSIDFKLGTKTVGTKATTKAFAIARATVVPMKAFTPTFNWPNTTDAFDYGVEKGASHKASYAGCTIANGTNTPTEEPYTVLDGVTYYPNLTYSTTYFKTGAKPGPESWTNQEEYGKVIPAHRCFSWKVNRPGKFDYVCCLWTTDRLVKYKVALLKTVNGVTSAKTIIDYNPAEDPDCSVYLFDSSNTTPVNTPGCHHEFEVTTEDLLGIDEAATLFFYGYNSSKLNITIYHYPITWTPSVD